MKGWSLRISPPVTVPKRWSRCAVCGCYSWQREPTMFGSSGTWCSQIGSYLQPRCEGFTWRARQRRCSGSSSWVCSGRRSDAGPARNRERRSPRAAGGSRRSEEHTSELQSHVNLVCRLLLEKKKKKTISQKQHKNKKKKQT